MKTEFITPSDRRWKDTLAAVPHDFYHLPEYLRFCERWEGGEAGAFWAESGGSSFLLPLLLRPIPEHLAAPRGWRDALTPYGYPSPLMRGGDESALRFFMEAFVSAARREEIVSAFLRLHPLLPLPPGVVESFGALVLHGETVYIDLTRTPEEIWQGVRENHRRDIRKLQRAGFRVAFDDWSLKEDFARIYRQTMSRLRAESFYCFQNDYFREIRDCLGERIHLAAVLSPEGDVAAAALFVLTNGIVEYHLGGTAEEYLCRAPSKLIFDFAWRWAREEGAKFLHLGGGLGGSNDSLYSFKAGFSRCTADFHTLRMIMDPERYSLLSASSTAPPEEPSGYFPTYRKRPVPIQERHL